MDYSNIEEQQLLNELNTSLEGLKEEEVINRQNKYGKNTLPKPKKNSVFKIFFSEFKNPIDYILFVTLILSIIVGEYVDAIFIFFIIILDAILGTIQEYKAAKDMESLLNLIKVLVKVRRNNKEKNINSEDLVIGDIVLIESGSKISADLRIIESYNLTVDESLLTGESIPVLKDKEIDNKEGFKSNLVYAGTSIMSGRAICVVIKTGIDTEVGKITQSIINEDSGVAPLVKKIEKFTKQISIYTVIIALILLIVLYFKNYQPIDIILSVIALSISAIPEGLPLAMTMALTIASRRMSKRNVIAKKLNSVETLGSITVIASDKTGTLTLNEQTAKKIMLPNGDIHDITGIGYNVDGEIENINDNVKDLVLMGLINNESSLTFDKKWSYSGDSIDIAFKALAYKANVDLNNIKILWQEPYESVNKYSATLYESNGYVYTTMKGSIEVVLNQCDTMYVNGKIKEIDKELLLEQNDFLASSGYRVIALAKKKNEDFIRQNSYDKLALDNLTFLGLVAFIDPIRDEVVDSIKKCRNASIDVIMITGDHPLTAYGIAKDLKIVNVFEEVATSYELNEKEKISIQEFDKYVLSKKVFARVTPNQKLKIVDCLIRHGEIVAVSGDGVNDAPALKKANIGIAMGSGTDVAKETASMIITDDNFSSIVAGIEEGRCAYSNIRKVIYFLLSCGISEVILFILSIIFDLELPLLAIQLLWLNLVTDGIQDIALSCEKKEEDIMNHKPRDVNEKIFNKLLIKEILVSGIYMGIVCFIFWFLILKQNLDIKLSRSYLMLFVVFIQNIHTFNCRSESKSLFKIPFKNNYVIYIGIGLTLTIQLLVSNIPYLSHLLHLEAVSLNVILLDFVCAISIILLMEIFKIKKKKNN